MTELQAALKVSLVMAEAIRDAGPRGIPSGHLYAAVMSVASLDAYNAILRVLQNKGWVRNSGHLLTWTGPAAPPSTLQTPPAGSGIVVDKLPRRRARKVSK